MGFALMESSSGIVRTWSVLVRLRNEKAQSWSVEIACGVVFVHV